MFSLFSLFSLFSQCRDIAPLQDGHFYVLRNILSPYMVTLFTRRVRSRGCADRRHPKRRQKCATQHNSSLIPNSSLKKIYTLFMKVEVDVDDTWNKCTLGMFRTTIFHHYLEFSCHIHHISYSDMRVHSLHSTPSCQWNIQHHHTIVPSSFFSKLFYSLSHQFFY